MKKLHVNNLLLYPRIRKCIKDSLDGVKGIKVIQESIVFNKRTEDIHKCLFELMQSCIDEIISQIKRYELK